MGDETKKDDIREFDAFFLLIERAGDDVMENRRRFMMECSRILEYRYPVPTDMLFSFKHIDENEKIIVREFRHTSPKEYLNDSNGWDKKERKFKKPT